MLAKRIIACLDVADGRVTKGTHFVNLRDAGDPVELAARYSDEGADEIVFLDISASPDGKETVSEVVAQVARRVFVPLTVGGGVRSVADARRLLNSGADKVGVNSAAVARPELIEELSEAFGAQCVVLAVDGRRVGESWEVFVNGGRTATAIDVLAWAAEGQRCGAGEILLTSMDADGTQAGFNSALVAAVCGVTTIPVVASGGAGSARDFVEVFQNTEASAALAASIFHFDQTSIHCVKEAILEAGMVVRPA